MKNDFRLLLVFTALTCSFALFRTVAAEREFPSPPEVHAERTIIAELGHEHLANAVYRRGVEGPRIAAWGDRIVQWPLQPAATTAEVVSTNKARVTYSNGGCAMDLQGDGIDEVIVCRIPRVANGSELLWWEEKPGQRPWQEHLIARLDHERLGAPHDLVPFVMAGKSGPARRGVVAVITRRQLVWFELPEDVRGSWPQHSIATLPAKKQSGIAIGDIAGHGRPDVACGMFWAECPPDPTSETWKVHRFGTWDGNGWGGMTKHGLADFDGDGQIDIVAAEAEIPESRLAIFTRKPGDPDANWESHPIDTGLYCPHSLIVADVNADGRPDVLVGEMTAGGWSFPLNPKPQLLLYLNNGHLRFTRVILDTGWGIHEMRLAPPRQDGKLQLCAADEIQLQKFKDMNTHVVLWTLGVQR